jgi:glucose-1-phosphate thymidylyltransferase
MESEGVRKAVVLARGLGTRMRRADNDAVLNPAQAAAADAGLKAFVPVEGGRPFLDYSLAALADAGLTDVCLVIGPEHGMVREYYEGRRGPSRPRVHVAIQERAIGTADAVLAAESFAGGDPFLVLNADNYYPVAVLAGLRRRRAPALPAFDRATLVDGGNIPPDRIARFALLEVARDGRLRRIWEKPDEATAARLVGAPVSMNVWLFTPRLVQACREVPPSPRGEVELPLAVQLAVDQGVRIETWPVRAPVLDLTERGDIAGIREHLARLGARW